MHDMIALWTLEFPTFIFFFGFQRMVAMRALKTNQWLGVAHVFP